VDGVDDRRPGGTLLSLRLDHIGLRAPGRDRVGLTGARALGGLGATPESGATLTDGSLPPWKAEGRRRFVRSEERSRESQGKESRNWDSGTAFQSRFVKVLAVTKPECFRR
jgi:hypothetical protein